MICVPCASAADHKSKSHKTCVDFYAARSAINGTKQFPIYPSCDCMHADRSVPRAAPDYLVKKGIRR